MPLSAAFCCSSLAKPRICSVSWVDVSRNSTGNCPPPGSAGGVTATRLALSTKDDPTGALAQRYLGTAPSAVYLIRPDQHVSARFPEYDVQQIRFAIRRATGKE